MMVIKPKKALYCEKEAMLKVAIQAHSDKNELLSPKDKVLYRIAKPLKSQIED